MTENRKVKAVAEAEMKGWLFKWTNYLKGYQKRWFVLTNGLLSYYRNQAEMAHTCRGTISLHGALIHTEDSCTFVISNGATQTFHLKAANEVERQSWVTSLELAKNKAIRALESEEDEEFEDGTKNDDSSIKVLAGRLEDIKTCLELISKHGTALQRALSELENLEPSQDFCNKIKAIKEKATLFRITSNAMTNACTEFLNIAEGQCSKTQRLFQNEREKKMKLEVMVEQLAKQLSILEQAAKDHNMHKRNSPSTDDDDDDIDFYDAQGDNSVGLSESPNFIMTIPTNQRRNSTHNGEGDPDEGSDSNSDAGEGKVIQVITDEPHDNNENLSQHNNPSDAGGSNTPTETPTSLVVSTRRTCIPFKPDHPLNLWSIMKNCIGKELSKIPMPVNFSEPLSMLQRLVEDFEYSELLDRAAECKDSCEQLAYVAAFTISSYATTAVRTGKPFNPLLGETYEWDRRSDLGWRVVSEQVSHHPPMVAQFCEGKRWKCWQEFTMTSKFRGKYLQVIPLGIAHLEFDSGNHYTWRKVTTTVHNIIVGKLWVDQHGDMDITNHTDGSKCHLKYIPYSYFNRNNQRKVNGCVMDKEGCVRWVVNGTWDTKIEIAPVIGTEGTKDNPVYKTGHYTTAWKVNDPLPDSHKFYNFTLFACQLNEIEEGVAPTDSRNRPDQRLMEDGLWDEANDTKLKLEEKQRAARRLRESIAEKASATGHVYQAYEPLWFKKEMDSFTGNISYIYKGNYWESKEKGQWTMCPNIF